MVKKNENLLFILFLMLTIIGSSLTIKAGQLDKLQRAFLQSNEVKFDLLNFTILNPVNTTNEIEKAYPYRQVDEVENNTFTALQTQEITVITYKQSTQSHNLIYFAYGSCNNSTCPLDRGECLKLDTCKCNQHHAQINNTRTESGEMCNYKLKNQLTAFLLETFLVFGIGHFYCGRILNGVLKLFVFAIIIVLDILFKTSLKSKNWKTQRFYYILFYSLDFCLLFWHTFDVIMFGLNKYRDGNDIQLWVNGDILTTL